MITVAMVDDHKLLRNGLSSFIRNNPDFEVLFEADNGIDLQQKIKQHPLPNVILMDINMPLMDGYSTTQWLFQNYKEVKVIALSMYDSEECIIRMLRCGAKGYILKDAEPSELLRAMDEVHRHGFYYSPMVAHHLIHIINNTETDPKQVPAKLLSERELELLHFMASEMTYKEIADKMFLSPKTVEGYREKICEKLQVKTRVGLVMYAIRNGIVKL
jgi:two-component system invasion response regulator UvrY